MEEFHEERSTYLRSPTSYHLRRNPTVKNRNAGCKISGASTVEQLGILNWTGTKNTYELPWTPRPKKR